jgi:hypothetical protein
MLRFGYKFTTLAGVARHLSSPRWIAASRAWKMTLPAPTFSSSSLIPVTYTWDSRVQLSPTSSHQALRTELSPAVRARGGARAGSPLAHAQSPSSGLVPVRVGLSAPPPPPASPAAVRATNNKRSGGDWKSGSGGSGKRVASLPPRVKKRRRRWLGQMRWWQAVWYGEVETGTGERSWMWPD